MLGRNRLQHFTFGVLGRRRLPEPDGGGVRLVGRGQQPEDLGGALDADHQHPGRHRIQRAGVADLAGAEEPPAPADDVVAGHARRLVDDDQARASVRGRAHSTIAVSTRPLADRPAAGQRGQRRPVLGRRDRSGSATGTPPALPVPSTLEGDVRILEPEPPVGQREPRLVRRLLGAEQDSIPVQRRRAARASSTRSAGRLTASSTPLGSTSCGFGVDADGSDVGARPTTAPRKPVAVRQAAHHTVGPARFTLVPLEDWHRRQPQLAERLAGAVPHRDELVAPLGHRRARSAVPPRAAAPDRAGRRTVRPTRPRAGSTLGQQPARHLTACS